MTYFMVSPLWHKGQTVLFRRHNGALRIGTIAIVETKYIYLNDGTAQTSHMYHVLPMGCERRVIISEDQIEGAK